MARNSGREFRPHSSPLTVPQLIIVNRLRLFPVEEVHILHSGVAEHNR